MRNLADVYRSGNEGGDHIPREIRDLAHLFEMLLPVLFKLTEVDKNDFKNRILQIIYRKKYRI